MWVMLPAALWWSGAVLPLSIALGDGLLENALETQRVHVAQKFHRWYLPTFHSSFPGSSSLDSTIIFTRGNMSGHGPSCVCMWSELCLHMVRAMSRHGPCSNSLFLFRLKNQVTTFLPLIRKQRQYSMSSVSVKSPLNPRSIEIARNPM